MATKKKVKRAKPEADVNNVNDVNDVNANGEAADRREYIATVALGGLLANTSYAVVGRAARRALDEADALIKMLDANDAE